MEHTPELNEPRRQRPRWTEGDWLKLRDGNWWAVPPIDDDLDQRPAMLRYLRAVSDGEFREVDPGDQDAIVDWMDRLHAVEYDALAEALLGNYWLSYPELRALIGSRSRLTGLLDPRGEWEAASDFDFRLVKDAGCCLANLVTGSERFLELGGVIHPRRER